MSPTTPPSPMQPLPTAFQQPPKKKRTGLIVGIVLGSIAVIGIITAVLLYFLWWQNPQKAVTDALVGAVTAQKSITEGTIKVKSKDFTVDVAMKSSTDAPKSSFDTTVKMSGEQLGELGQVELKLAGAMDEKGTIYLKADGIQKILDSVIDLMMEMGAGSGASQSELRQYEQQLKQGFEPIVKKIDGQWLKISMDDFDVDKETKCMTDVMTEIQNDPKLMKEAAGIYRKHPFIVIKDGKVESRNGATGYEIDLVKMNDGSGKEFADAMGDSEIVKKFKSCTDGSSSEDGYRFEDSTSTGGDDLAKNTQVRIWVSPFSHKLTEVEIENKSDDVTTTMSYKFNIGKADTIEIPSDAKSAKDVMEEVGEDMEDLGEMFSGLVSGGATSSSDHSSI